MIAATRTTLALLLAVLASSVLPGLQASAGAIASGNRAAVCEPLDLASTTAVRAKADDATDVFAGKVRSAKALQSVDGGTGRAGREDKPRKPSDWTHTVQVTATFRTDLRPGDRVQVTTTPTAEGGLAKLVIGRTYLFFVTTEQGMDHFATPACSGTQLLRGGLSAQQQSALKAALASEPVAETPEVDLSAPSDGTRVVPDLGRLAAPGAAVALVGVLGLLLLSRVGKRRA
ncbi:hypothetical protein [Nocardioides sp. MH1]|uniref:hypothetical protein n=1 Tax=Nocardioides sp. MH1 TaxID=3242490 RepID=UPI0035208DD9